MFRSQKFYMHFGPDTWRHRLWRRGNTARRHTYGAELWRDTNGSLQLGLTWHRRGFVARRRRSWRRATETYKTVALLAEKSSSSLISKLRQKLMYSKFRVATLHRPSYGVSLIRFVYWVVLFRLLVSNIAHNIYCIINMMSIFHLIVCANLL
jgi:hypothetical protein